MSPQTVDEKIATFSEMLEAVPELDKAWETFLGGFPPSPTSAQIEERHETRDKYEKAHAAASAALRACLPTNTTDEMYIDKYDYETLSLAYKCALNPEPVLVLGERGTGKSFFARFISEHVSESKKIQEVNCSMISHSLIESELFGHEKGAFTNATAQRIGKLEAAKDNTLFIDEMQAASPEAQQAIKTFIETKRFYRVGGEKEITSVCKVVIASNVMTYPYGLPLDLVDRLTYHLCLLPLRERPDSIERFIISYLKQKFPKDPRQSEWLWRFQKAKPALAPWPGNIRGLLKWMKRSIAEGRVVPIDGDTTPPIITKPTPAAAEAEIQRMRDEGKSWREIAQGMTEKYGDGYSEDTMRRRRRMLKGKPASLPDTHDQHPRQ